MRMSHVFRDPHNLRRLFHLCLLWGIFIMLTFVSFLCLLRTCCCVWTKEGGVPKCMYFTTSKSNQNGIKETLQNTWLEKLQILMIWFWVYLFIYLPGKDIATPDITTEARSQNQKSRRLVLFFSQSLGQAAWSGVHLSYLLSSKG